MATELERQLALDNQLFMPQMTVRAMRDSRYRHPANAIAELIDNSIDARANRVDLLIRETEQMVSTRRRWRIDQIGVFDNGQGMSARALVQALRFGGRQQSGSINRIGKYGMGLPTSSVSQCRRVDVWTWQDDIQKAVHSYIDVDLVEEGTQIAVPDADQEPIPDEWMSLVARETLNPNRGTLVVWSRPDRIKVQALTIVRQVEEEIGRIYRHYINAKDLHIRMASIRNGEAQPYIDQPVRPNDPLYQMRDSSTPQPWNEAPMFEEAGSREFEIQVEGQEERVMVNFAIAKREALGEHKGDLPGNRLYGKHALKNMGISVVRENREILLENYFIREAGGGAVPQNRWWGCEIRFNSGADSLFGIDHNKQMAANVSRALKDLYEGMDGTVNDPEAVMQDLDVEDEAIYDIAKFVRHTVTSMMQEIYRRFEQRPTRGTSESDAVVPDTIEDTTTTLLTIATREIVEGDEEPLTETDRRRQTMDENERVTELTSGLVDDGYSPEQAEQKALETIRKDRWYTITPSQLDGYRIFSVRGEGGVLNVRLNINNHIYELINSVDAEAEANANPVVRNAAIAIRALILSWARMEDGTEDPDRKMALQEMSERWGKVVHRILGNLEIQNTMSDPQE